MKLHRFSALFLPLFVSLAFAADSAAPPAAPKAPAKPDPMMEPQDAFDRLDGTGASQAKVDVIDWAGNLEIHVYPKGRLKSLGMKIDRTQKQKPVMVVDYRFVTVTYRLIRRALLTMTINDGFKVYRDTSEQEFDKIIVTNHVLSQDVVPFALAPPPAQLYPDHYGEPEKKSVEAEKPSTYERQAKNSDGPIAMPGESGDEGDRQPARRRDGKPATRPADDDGALKSWNFR